MTKTSALAMMAQEFIDQARAQNLLLRLCGSVAAWWHCPVSRTWLSDLALEPSDIDFVGHLRDKGELVTLFKSHGFRPDPILGGIPGSRRAILYQIDGGRIVSRCDIYFEMMDFCHSIDLRDRLEADDPTIPLAELILSKLQIHDWKQVDIVNLQMLLFEHDLGPGDDETINQDQFAYVCGSGWGMWSTVSRNLNNLIELTLQADYIELEARHLIADRVSQLLTVLRLGRKKGRWYWQRFLSRVLPFLHWHNVVEDVGRTPHTRKEKQVDE